MKRKATEIKKAIEIVMEAINTGLVGPEPAEPGEDLYFQLTHIVRQIKKEIFWKRLKFWAYGPLVFSSELFGLKSRRYKKLAKFCTYLLKSKDLREWVEGRAYMYLFNTYDPLCKESWAADWYSSGDKTRAEHKKKAFKRGTSFKVYKTPTTENTEASVNVVKDAMKNMLKNMDIRKALRVEQKTSQEKPVRTKVKIVLDETLSDLDMKVDKGTEKRIIDKVTKKHNKEDK